MFVSILIIAAFAGCAKPEAEFAIAVTSAGSEIHFNRGADFAEGLAAGDALKITVVAADGSELAAYEGTVSNGGSGFSIVLQKPGIVIPEGWSGVDAGQCESVWRWLPVLRMHASQVQVSEAGGEIRTHLLLLGLRRREKSRAAPKGIRKSSSG
jgi:hypothetical protein